MIFKSSEAAALQINVDAPLSFPLPLLMRRTPCIMTTIALLIFVLRLHAALENCLA